MSSGNFYGPYDAEQKQLEEAVLSIQQEIEVQEQQIENIEKFVQKAHKHIHIKYDGLGYIPLDELEAKEKA